MLRFLCGLRKFYGYPRKELNTLCVDESSDDAGSIILEVTIDTLHCLFEAQDNDVIAESLGSSDIQLYTRYSQVTHFDCFVLGYCVSHSNRTWKIDFRFCSIGDKGVEMLMQSALEEETHYTGEISEMDLSGNNITYEGVKHLLKFPKRLLNKLETLKLDGNKIDSEFHAVIGNFFLLHIMPHLKIVSLSSN